MGFSKSTSFLPAGVLAFATKELFWEVSKESCQRENLLFVSLINYGKSESYSLEIMRKVGFSAVIGPPLARGNF